MNLRNLLDDLRIEYREHGQHHHTTEGRINVDCVWCSRNSGRFRMGVHLWTGRCHCWTCGGHSTIWTFVELTGKSPDEVQDLLGGLLRPDREDTVGIGVLRVPACAGPLQKPHVNYLASRGFDAALIAQKWGVLGIGLAPKLAWRVWIPVHYRGKVVSWTTRAIVDNYTPRYVSARADEEEVSGKRLLYGEQFARHTVIVVEGPLDAWRIGDGAVATLGTSYSRAQLEKISRFPTRIICFDGEPEAQRRADQLLDALTSFPGRTMKVILDTKDAASASDKEINQLRRLLR